MHTTSESNAQRSSPGLQGNPVLVIRNSHQFAIICNLRNRTPIRKPDLCEFANIGETPTNMWTFLLYSPGPHHCARPSASLDAGEYCVCAIYPYYDACIYTSYIMR